MNYCFCESPLGILRIEEEKGNIVRLTRDTCRPEKGQDYLSPLLQNAIRQLQEYFQGKRKNFDLPLVPEGTVFQKKAWEVLLTIPYGQTISYGEEAKRTGSGCPRAVGQANGKNPIAIVIPCHRVVRADGALGGYTGGLDMKQFLLTLERQYR